MVNSFLQYLQYEKNYSSHTVLSYHSDLLQFQDFLKQSDQDFIPQNIKAEIIRSWLMELRDSGISARTVNRKLSALKSFYRFLLKQGLVTTDPTAKINSQKKSKKLPTFFSEKELDQAFENSENLSNFEAYRNQAILETFYQTGIRLSELINLKDTDLDFSRNTIRVFGKRSKERIIPFGESLKEFLQTYIRERDKQVKRITSYLYVRADGKKMYPKLVYRIVLSTMSAVTTQTKCSPHVLRHTFATTLLNNGADINAVKKLLGHANLAATEVYTHTTFEQLQHIYEQAHPRAKKKRSYGN
ncbi:MAG TPA: tyrosine-type recombinase/integrase [Paludibacteraceae bacterium]|nr:tyrosine-type recombinase/integrase [Paludibacteraceae bacterium]HQB69572.1 tyrosine-type recombinase/integrase [Paludibacteraceae bacterium]